MLSTPLTVSPVTASCRGVAMTPPRQRWRQAKDAVLSRKGRRSSSQLRSRVLKQAAADEEELAGLEEGWEAAGPTGGESEPAGATDAGDKGAGAIASAARALTRALYELNWSEAVRVARNTPRSTVLDDTFEASVYHHKRQGRWSSLGVQHSPGMRSQRRSALQLAADIDAPRECREALLEVALSVHGEESVQRGAGLLHALVLQLWDYALELSTPEVATVPTCKDSDGGGRLPIEIAAAAGAPQQIIEMLAEAEHVEGTPDGYPLAVRGRASVSGGLCDHLKKWRVVCIHTYHSGGRA